MTRWLIVGLIVVLGGGCSSDKQATPGNAAPAQATPPREVPPDPEPPRPARTREPAVKGTGTGTAALTFTGAIQAEVTGDVVRCGFTHLKGKDQGGSWQVDAADFKFSIGVHEDTEWDRPLAILNATRPERMSYVYVRGSGPVKAATDRTVAEIDADLKNVVGTQRVHVKGTMTCPARVP